MMSDRAKAADLLEKLIDAVDHNWGTHYPCLRDDLADLAHDVRSEKVTPTIECVVAVLNAAINGEAA